MNLRTPALAALAGLVMLVLGSCGGSGGGGATEPEPPPPEVVGVFSGFKDSGNLEWESAGGSDGGVGDGGADGDGGVGAGGDFGQFRGANVCVFLDNGTQLGCALSDNLKGMVTIKPGRAYKGGLRIELSGTPTASYYEEGRDIYVPFPADRKIRVWVAAIERNIGITPFTEAAYRMLTEGSAPESVGSATPTKAQVRAANARVKSALNEHFPTALHVDDIARLPFIKSQGLPAGSMRTDPRGRYGLVNGAFSKQASFHNGDSTTPTLDAVRQLAEDLLDGRIDGRNGDQPAGPPGARTYDPNTLTGELSSALAEQAARFGAQEALDALPKVLNFGNVRYEGYLFDGSISKAGNAYSTVAGWVAANTRNLAAGDRFDRLPGQRALALYGNNGHGGGFYKADALGPRHKVYAIGDNVNGELGLGHRDPTVGRAVELTLPGAMTHAVGGFAHTVMRLANGDVYAWGDNSFGQLGQGQSPGTLPNSLTPMRVSLPRPALVVAATNVASYALLDDGSVWAWGSNGGFGLLGNGARDGAVLTPAAVPGITQVVQLVARDNDVAVVKRDHTIWHWGSFPADEVAHTPGDVSGAYRGGTLQPVAVADLPAGVAVRKVLTEQGLFAALMANGHVYHWGVHFDMTAGTILRDLKAQRILGLPPVRDLMPGGFIGYGARPFDRLTGMAVDYSGGMWKVRGRVAERFDPENPAAQRRPQGQAPRADCINCHTFLDESIEQLRARQPSTAGLPVCTPPSEIHTPGGASLIHAETDCVFCHNPSRANYPLLRQPFADTGFWQNCAKPDNLPARSQISPTPINNSCSVPLNHSYTPPGTVCASCHNSVIARPLNTLDPVCAQPRSSELPGIATVATLGGVFDSAGAAIAQGSTTRTVRHELRGSLSVPLGAGQSIEVTRNQAVIGTATAAGVAWTFASASNTPEGTSSFTVRVAGGSGTFGRTSNTIDIFVDSVPPAATAAIAGFTDDSLGALASGAFASDPTPTVNGTLSTTLGAGETVQVLRGGTVLGTATVGGGGTSWSLTEPADLAPGSYSWQARTIDTAGNATNASTSATLTLVAAPPSASVTQVVNDLTNVVVAPGGATNDATPTVRGTLSAGLPAGYLVRVFRDGASMGSATVVGTNWSLVDPGASNGEHSYSARTEAGAVLGATSATYTITIDTQPPTQTANVTQIADDVNGALANGATTADTTPIVSGTLSVALAAGEQVRVLRNSAQVALVGTATTNWTYTEPAPIANGAHTYQVQVVDAAGQLGPLGATRSVTVDAAAVPLQNAATFLNTINGVAPVAAAVPVNDTAAPVLAGTIQRPLLAGEVVKVYRGLNGSAPVPVGNATVNTVPNPNTWSFTNTTLADGTYTFRAQIEQVANPLNFGLSSATVTDPIDNTDPAQTVTITNVRESSGGTVVANAGYTTDTTPFLEGTLSAPLGAGEQLQILRGATVLTPTVIGQNWTLQEPVLAGALYSYTARVRDAASNLGLTSAARTVNVVTNLPTTTISTINGLSNGASSNDTTPTVNISLSANLPASYTLRVFRENLTAGTAPVTAGTLAACVTPCSFTEPVALPATSGTTYRYTARTEIGAALGGTSNTRTVVLDTVDPATPSISGRANNKPYQNNNTSNGVTIDWDQTFGSGATVGDPNPQIVVTLSPALGTGEAAALFLWNGSVWNQVASVGAGSGSITYNQAAALNSPPFAPSAAVSRFYYATRTDAAGNAAQTSNFSFTQDYLNCSQPRALTKFPAAGNPTHGTWPAGTANCTGCHSTDLAAGFVAAPPPTYTDRYWCRKG